MSPSDEPTPPNDLALRNRIDAICDDFERDLKKSPDANPLAFLPADWSEDEKDELLRHLLEVDADHRIRRGAALEADDYLRRFPNHFHVVEAVFSRLREESPPRQPGEPPHAKQPTSESSRDRNQLASTHSLGATDEMRSFGGGILPGVLLANRYRIVSVLGQGAMGEVYQARDLKLGVSVALKLLPKDVATDQRRLDLFLNEARLARQIAHPHICRVFDIGLAEGRHFLSMEYIDGEDLASLIHRIGPLPTRKVIELAQQMCAGLAAAHDSGVIHRDLKPANIMIDGQGNARIADFGLARPTKEEGSAKELVGTPAYMAPEQFRQMETSVRSDLYALGLILYEMVSGERAHPATTRSELEWMLRQPPPFLSLESGLGDELALREAVLWCMQTAPQDRPASARALAASLPGGDPLAIAMAAGETLSPGAVAASRDHSLPSPPVAWTCFGASLLGLFSAIVLWSVLAGKLGFGEESPHALASKMRERLGAMEVQQTPPGEAYGIALDREYLKHLAEENVAWDRLPHRDPPPAYFWYRSSQRPLVARIPDWSGETFLAVDEWRPAFAEPGMVRARSDLSGRLISLEALPVNPDAASQPSSGGPAPVDDQTEPDAAQWDQLFEMAGVSRATRSSWKSVPAKSLPPGYADERQAWTGDGVLADFPNAAARIEVAAFDGRPVLLQVSGDMSASARSEVARMAGVGELRSVLVTAWMCLLIVGGALMAWRNLKRGRSDRNGAVRVARCLFFAALAAWLLRDTHVTAGVELDLLFTALAAAVLFAAFFWCSYVALEPDARRLWPRTLVGWNRVLIGRWRDPVVGRELLFGVGAGVAAANLKLANALWPAWFGLPSDSLATITNLHPLMGIREALGDVIASGGLAIMYALFTQLLFLLLLRVLFGGNFLAATAYVVFMSLLVASRHHQFTSTLLFTAIEMILTVFLFLRSGLLSVAVMHFVRLLLKWPLLFAYGYSWGGDAGLLAIFLIVGLSALGLWLVLKVSRGPRPLQHGG